VVFEPAGPAWLPVAVFFDRRGHDVYRVSLAKAAGLRRFLRRPAKSNGIDAETLARIPLAGPGGLPRLERPGADAAALDRRVRACARLTQAAAEHKTRVKDLGRQLMPVTPLTGDIGQPDPVALERYGDPRAPPAAGLAELTPLITAASHHQQGPDRARQWRDAAAAAIELHDGHPAVPFTELAAEVTTEIRLLRALAAELAAHATAREQHYRHAGPDQPRPLPARLRRDQRPRPDRPNGPARPVPRRDEVQVLRGPGPQGPRNRRDRPPRPAHDQSRVPGRAPRSTAPPTPPGATTPSSPRSTTPR
jgi:hypothetical protein